jgi:hypothetical protein
MTIGERVELKKRGINVLRPMFDSRKNMWKIAICTISGGWGTHGVTLYATKELAQTDITELVQEFPLLFKSDD